jgi:hypothetical protein
MRFLVISANVLCEIVLDTYIHKDVERGLNVERTSSIKMFKMHQIPILLESDRRLNMALCDCCPSVLVSSRTLCWVI